MAPNLVNRHPAVDTALLRWCRVTTLHLLRALQKDRVPVTVVLTTDEDIAVLNERYRGRPGPTNVLSFASEPAGDVLVDSLRRDELGDIFISVDTAGAEAKVAGEPLTRRLDSLIAHGLLHLLGHDHERSAAEAIRMTKQELNLTGSLPQQRRYAMPHLAVNVDHVATVRQARGTNEPDPVTAAAICELAGARGIVVHLREDRRHIQDRDVRLLRETVKTKLNLEMGAAREIIDFALDLVPDMVTLVPEKRQELTTEGGLDVAGQKKKLTKTVAALHKAGIPVSLFIDPEVVQVKAAREVGATFVELHTGAYAEAPDEASQFDEFELIRTAAEEAHLSGLRVNAGHGLDYVNTAPVAGIEVIEELSIGHAIIARSLFSGLEEAVRDMVAIVENGGLY